MDLFYDEGHTCKIDLITRLKSGGKDFRTMASGEFASLEQKENFVRYEDRSIFIKKRHAASGPDKTDPAWMYLGLDTWQRDSGCSDREIMDNPGISRVISPIIMPTAYVENSKYKNFILAVKNPPLPDGAVSGRGYFFVLEMVLLFEHHRMGLKQACMPQTGLKIHLWQFPAHCNKTGLELAYTS